MSLEAKFSIAEQKLIVDYQFINRGNAPVYLTDIVVFNTKDGTKILRDMLYFQQDDFPLVVFFSKLDTTPLPPGMATAAPRSTYGTRVEPGQTHQGQFALQLPIPIKRPSWVFLFNSTIKQAALEFGVIPHDNGLQAEKTTVDGREVYWLNFHAWDVQQVLRSPVQEISIPTKVE
ncbi:MAG: hypothetical protein MUC97_09070 [Bernardetiaceae bacterium]|jgi:hypothetical protein|nr:hypothetical protein [Bernardetiaceae bacterium]